MLKKVVLLAFIVLGLCSMSAPASAIDGVFPPAGDPTFMYVNPGGLGDALVYGYYNVRDEKVSVFTVVNTDTANGARVRIRFREAADIAQSANQDCDLDLVEDPQGSHEVLDFDICLSAGDMWTGRIISDASGAATLRSNDDDTFVQFTDDPVTGVAIFPTRFPNGVQFKFGAANPVTNITADNTREGYFEIIAERQLSEACDTIANNGIVDCTCGDQFDLVGTDVGNVLFGSNFIVDLGDASTYGYNATAIAEFAASDKTSPIASARPNLRDDHDELINPAPDITPVNYILTKSNLYAVHDTEDALGGNTEIVVTFPTKKLTQDQFGCVQVFADPIVGITVWDDAENTQTTVCEFSPCPPGSENLLPFEVNVLDLNASNLFTSDVETELVSSFNIGWLHINLITGVSTPLVAHSTTQGSATALGLPAIAYDALGFGIGGANGATQMLPVQYDVTIFGTMLPLID